MRYVIRVGFVVLFVGLVLSAPTKQLSGQAVWDDAPWCSDGATAVYQPSGEWWCVPKEEGTTNQTVKILGQAGVGEVIVTQGDVQAVSLSVVNDEWTKELAAQTWLLTVIVWQLVCLMVGVLAILVRGIK